MKIILVLLDGLGDRSYGVLNHQTPLQAAKTPNLDTLARLGSNGLFHAALPGQCLPSETAHYLLFGYDMKDFPGRGLFEALGYGVPFEEDDVLCLAHFSNVKWRKWVPILSRGRKEIQGDDLGELFDSVSTYESQGITFRLHRTRLNDGILVMSGGASPHVSDSDPMVAGRPMAMIRPILGNPEPDRALRAAGALNNYLTWCHRVLTDHDANRRREAGNLPPANFLATQRCGRRIPQEPFEKRWGLPGMFIASGAVFGGLAHELGLTYVGAEDGPDPGWDLRERIRLALSDTAHDFFHVHTKVPDEAAHRGDPGEKKTAISALDRGLAELVKALERRDDLLVGVTADHSTPSISPLIHSGEPSPLLIAGPTVRRDQVDTFDEVSAATGCLGLLRGKELMLTLLNHADRSVLLGHRLGERERPYFPEGYEPFKVSK
jgi:2,3-bisphosphoglycerate-independent phosphoglycerate mutase